MDGERARLSGLAAALARATGRDAYLLDNAGQVVCRNGQPAWGAPPAALCAHTLTQQGRTAGLIALDAAGLDAELYQALDITVRAYALMAALGAESSAEEPLAEGIRRYILAHLADDLSGDALAAALYVSRSTVARAVKERTGLSLRLYIQSLRLDAARALLLQSKLPITQVAARCGVSDFNYFSRIYKRRFGQTPTQTRTRSLAGQAAPP